VDDPLVPVGSPNLTIGKTGLSWTSVTNATGYDVVRGSLNQLLSSGGDFATSTEECLANNLPSTFLGYESVPAAGRGSWFLVRAVSCGGAGSYNESSGSQVGNRDLEIAASASACP
jgi:hypothetical protein